MLWRKQAVAAKKRVSPEPAACRGSYLVDYFQAKPLGGSVVTVEAKFESFRERGLVILPRIPIKLILRSSNLHVSKRDPEQRIT